MVYMTAIFGMITVLWGGAISEEIRISSIQVVGLLKTFLL